MTKLAVSPRSDELLHEVLTELRAIRAVLERPQRPVAVLSRADRDLLSRLLPVITAIYGSAPFTSRDLVEDTAPGLRLVVGDMSAKSIGRLLGRAVNTPIVHLMVQRNGVAINVTAWRVMAC